MKSTSESESEILWAVEEHGFQVSKADNIVGAPCSRAHRHHRRNTTKSFRDLAQQSLDNLWPMLGGHGPWAGVSLVEVSRVGC
jgi:hypothetical protein